MSVSSVVIIGAGQAGLQVADSLRRGGYEGTVTLIGNEDALPYQRPPLSKQYMTSDMEDARLAFRPADYFDKQNIQLALSETAASVDRANKTVTTGERSYNYDKLVLTTGATVRRLPVPGGDLPQVHYLRSVADARAIRAELVGGSRCLAAVGGGFIGLEMAAAARELGHDVTVVEALDRLMARAVSPQVSNFYSALHRGRGVDVRLDTAVSEIAGHDDGAVELKFADGDSIVCDIIVVGIGSIPHTEIAEAAGLECTNGIVVDEFARTSDPNILAAGDCTMHKNAALGVTHRLESVQNAVDQAKVVAATILEDAKPYVQIPWFWSDQYDVKLQMVGTSIDHDSIVTRGSEADNAFSLFYFKGERLIGVDSVNRPADHLVSRKLIAAGVAVPAAAVRDIDNNLKELLN